MSSRKITDLDTRIQPFVTQLLNEFNSLGNDGWVAFITDGRRTQEEQNALYAQGRTTPGPIVTWTLNSNHVKGLAVDIAFQKNGVLSYDQKYYDVLVPIAKRLGFNWGGDWKVLDKPHFEMLEFNPGPIAQTLTDENSILELPSPWNQISVKDIISNLNSYLLAEQGLNDLRNQVEKRIPGTFTDDKSLLMALDAKLEEGERAKKDLLEATKPIIIQEPVVANIIKWLKKLLRL